MSSLQELRTALAIGAPADRDQLAGLLWRRGLPCRPVQLPPQWWAEAADLEAGLWIAADQQQPPRWWLVQQGRRRPRVLPLQEAAGPPPAPAELQLGALSLWPRLAGPPQPLGRALAHYLQLGATVRRVLPAAALRAGLWLLLPLLLLGLLRRQGPPGLLLAVAVLSLALGLVLDRQWQQLWFNRSQRQRAALGLNGMQRVLRLPLPQLQRLGGAGATALGLALQELGQELPLALGRLLAALALLLSGGVALLLWRPQVGLIALAACLLWTAATLWVLRRRAGLRSTQGQWRALAQRRSQELIEVASSLRLAGAEERALTWWLEQEGAAQGLQPQLDRWDQALGGIALAAVTACLAAVLVGVDPAAVPLGLSLVAILLGGTWQLSLELQHLERLRPSWQGSQLLLASPAEARPEAADPGVLEGALAVRDLSFRYGPEQPLVLDRVSFEAPAGSFVAVVGPSGSGKSTLLRLLLGFEVPQQGQICFDGRDATGLQHELLRPQIGTVLQQARLVGGTLLEVIAAGRPISVEQAWMAAEQAGLAEELRALPMGLQTLVPAGGSTFSGGQRQRLAIARALVGQPRLLLFDEPTSALDNHSQQTVLRSLEALAITRVLVAHRLSTVRQADQILVLDRGRLVQRGRFDALLAAPGLFAELMQRQTL